MNLFTMFDVGAAWRWGSFVLPIVAATYASPAVVSQLADLRCRDLIRHARAKSRFYAKRFQHLPVDAALTEHPSVSRAELMVQFDDWVTDPAIRLTDVNAFIADPGRCGEAFLGRYAVWTSSGTTGVPGVYVSDPDTLAIHEALLTTRTAGSSGASSLWQLMMGGGRLALIAAQDGHFAGMTTWERARRASPWLNARSRAFPVTARIEELVAALNDWQPALLASYPSMLSVMADELEAGRLMIEPTALWSGGEELPPFERERLSQAFACPVHEEYAASECMNIAFSCSEGSLHLHADWVILEPVDERGRILPPGQPSASTLLTNLANHVQPLIRYQLGDSITFLADPCECGCPLPRLRVEGRKDDVLKLPAAHGMTITIVPLAIESVLEDRAGIHQFQLRQSGPHRLTVRFSPPAGLTRREAWPRVEHCLREFLDHQGARSTAISLDPAPPQADPVSGKLRRIRGAAASPRA
jgi:phenylacetate-coenzyme A ligase PaaK-like adenylate-forming protein